MRVSNGSCGEMVKKLKPFKANNLFSEIVGEFYVVFSYGKHWPMFAHKDGKLYENNESYSVTTSKHRGQAHPHADTIKMNKIQLQSFIG